MTTNAVISYHYFQHGIVIFRTVYLKIKIKYSTSLVDA